MGVSRTNRAHVQLSLITSVRVAHYIGNHFSGLVLSGTLMLSLSSSLHTKWGDNPDNRRLVAHNIDT
jgi:hypothetical protein